MALGYRIYENGASCKNYLEKCHEVYQEMANRYDWDIVECAKDNQLRTIEEIHEDVWQKIQGLIK